MYIFLLLSVWLSINCCPKMDYPINRSCFPFLIHLGNSTTHRDMQHSYKTSRHKQSTLVVLCSWILRKSYQYMNRSIKKKNAKSKYQGALKRYISFCQKRVAEPYHSNDTVKSYRVPYKIIWERRIISSPKQHDHRNKNIKITTQAQKLLRFLRKLHSTYDYQSNITKFRTLGSS